MRNSSSGGASPDLPLVMLLVPVYNEEDNLPFLAEEIRQAMEGQGRPWGLLLVDDGSTDQSLAVIRRLAGEDPRILYLALEANSGQSAALDAAFSRAPGDIFVTLDADLQNDPADIPVLLDLLDQGYDLAAGRRLRRQDGPAKRLASRLANAVRRAFLRDGISDTGCSLKAMRASLVRRLPPFRGMHRFLPALMLLRGAAIVQIPVNHRPRTRGVSKYRVLDRLWPGLQDLLGVWWLRRRRVSYSLKEEGLRRGESAAAAPALEKAPRGLQDSME
ncbi:MAG: glycosyltransferase family 2 protein [Desulfovibrio sp.]|jgi:glycosyltransferase involved in cell wall biosynthesis|nr:glycosyltransferase family 2 protein [Desulfovibrio sp.]